MTNILLSFTLLCGSIAVSWVEGKESFCRDGLSDQEATALIESLEKRGIRSNTFIGNCE